MCRRKGLSDREKSFFARLARKYETGWNARQVRNYLIVAAGILALFAIARWLPWWWASLIAFEAAALFLIYKHNQLQRLQDTGACKAVAGAKRRILRAARPHRPAPARQADKSFRERFGTAKVDAMAGIFGCEPGPEYGTEDFAAVEPGGALEHTKISSRGALQIFTKHAPIIFFIAPVRHPFGNVASHVHRAPGTCALEPATHFPGGVAPVA